MKHALMIFTTSILLVLSGWLLLGKQQQQPAGPTQEIIEYGGCTMLPPTVPVDKEIQLRVLGALAAQAPERGIFKYAITDISSRDEFYYASIAGLPSESETMLLQDALWLGTATLAAQPGADVIINDIMPSQPAGNEKENRGYGQGGSWNILPFRDGTTAIYGIRGVHDCGFSLNGWKAVDLFPEENQVYATQGGEVSYVCRDNTQVALRIGQNLYTHLVDSGQQMGDYYNQGQAMGGMVPGSYTAACGYADQQPNNYHVHFCYIPNPAGTWAADGYAINSSQGYWVKSGLPNVEVLGTLTADWAEGVAPGDPIILPGPSMGANFWDSLMGGFMTLVNGAVDQLPIHEAKGISEKVLMNIAPAVEMAYIVVLSNINMVVPMFSFGIIIVLEGVRITYALWMLIKRAIPIVG